MKKLFILALLLGSFSSHANCFSNMFLKGDGYLNNYFVIDEPSTCCDNIKGDAKSAIKIILKKITCNKLEIGKVMSNSIQCIGRNGGGVCEMVLSGAPIVIQVAIEHGEQPITHVIFNDNH